MAKTVFEKIFKGKKLNEGQIEKYINKVSGGVDLLNRAFAKLGLAADYFKEQPPFETIGFDFGTDGVKPKIKYFRKSDKFVSELLVKTYLLFGSRQLYIYSVSFNSQPSMAREVLTEIFYRDISSVTVESALKNYADSNDNNHSIYNHFISITFGNERFCFPTVQDIDINNERLFDVRKFIRDKKFLG